MFSVCMEFVFYYTNSRITQLPMQCMRAVFVSRRGIYIFVFIFASERPMTLGDVAGLTTALADSNDFRR